MGQLLSYSITSAVFMIPLYLVFRLLMSGERQPTFNRVALHVVYIVALIAPALCRIDWVSLTATQFPEPQAEVVAGIPFGGYVAAVDEAVAPVWKWIVLLYAVGVLVVTLMTGVSLLALARLVRSAGEVYRSDDFTVYVLHDARGMAPFSFMNSIVLLKSDYDSADVSRLIILHESCHVRHRHWIDLMLAQAVCIVQWFNPAAWLLRDELRSVHEYQVDADVLCALHGNISLYQNLLIKKAVGARFPSLANSLNHSNLKKRITMMYKSKPSSARRLAGALAVVPAMIGAVMLVNVPSVSAAISSIGSTTFEPVRKITKIPAAVQQSQVPVEESGQEKLSDINVIARNHMMPAAESVEAPAVNATSQASVAPAVVADSHPAEKTDKKVVEETVDKVAEFPGGLSGLMTWLRNNVRYPKQAYINNIQGTVIVKFVVDKEGKVIDGTIARSIDPTLDNEALRVVNEMPRWTPAELNGEPVASEYTLPVAFKLNNKPAEKKADSAESLQTTMTIRSGDKEVTLKSDQAAFPTVMVNGEISESSVLNSIRPDDVKSISVINNDPDYPNGLVKIILKSK